MFTRYTVIKMYLEIYEYKCVQMHIILQGPLHVVPWVKDMVYLALRIRV